jgi:hypothetical protein
MFNVSRLKVYHDGFTLFPGRPQAFKRPPPESITESGAEIYEVDRIMATRGRGNRQQYLVLWQGYPLESATWEPIRHLKNASKAIADFHRSVSED